MTYSNTIRWSSGRSAIEIILLDINTIDGNVRELDILPGNVVHSARCAGVSLYARAVLGVEDLTVGEDYSVDYVIRFAADGAD